MPKQIPSTEQAFYRDYLKGQLTPRTLNVEGRNSLHQGAVGVIRMDFLSVSSGFRSSLPSPSLGMGDLHPESIRLCTYSV